MLRIFKENRRTNVPGFQTNIIMAAYWKIKCDFTPVAS